MISYTVTNKDGLLVHSKLDTTSQTLRKMANGESFKVYQLYPVNTNQIWGRLTDNPGNVSQEYTCLQIANKEFATLDSSSIANGFSPDDIAITVLAFGASYSGVLSKNP